MVKNIRLISFVVVMLTIMLAACGNNDGNNENEGTNDSTSGDENTANTKMETDLGQKKLTMPYVSWASTIAGVNVIKAVLEDVGYEVDLKQVEAGAMFAALASGSGDISVGAVTLPHTHKSYWEEYEDQIVDIGVTMKDSVTMGLTVPSYVKIDSIEDLRDNTNQIGEKMDWTIVGIDAGAGEMELTKNEVIPDYGLEKWDLVASSGPAMTASLAKAIESQDPIVVTLWEPHWAFIEWDLKYLEDPKNIYGEPDSIHAVSRQGLKEDAPAAYKILDQFHWTSEDMGEVMVMTHDGMDPYEAGKKWVENNQDKVKEWTKGVK